MSDEIETTQAGIEPELGRRPAPYGDPAPDDTEGHVAGASRDAHTQGRDRTMHRPSTRKRPPAIIAGAMAAAVMALIASSASASASYPNEVHARDVNADGIFDGYELDRWGDGTPDFLAGDFDNNGWLETFGVDFNNDGFTDAFAHDSQQNGVFDILWFDTDLDGVLDRLILDINEDGLDDRTAVGYVVGSVGGSTVPNPYFGTVGGGTTSSLPWPEGTFGNLLGSPDSDGDGQLDDGYDDYYPRDPDRH